MRNDGQVKQKLLNADGACGKNSYLHLFNGCYTKRTGKNRLSFFYRNNAKKYGGIVPHIVPHIVPNIVPHIVLDIVPIMCYTILVKMYVGDRYAKNDEYKRGGKPLEYQRQTGQ